jgi:hypothetical protein
MSDVSPAVPEKPSLDEGIQPALGATFIHVIWQAVPGALSYDLMVETQGSAPVKHIGLAVSSFHLTSLIPNKPYSISARAVNASGVSAFSTSLNVCTVPPTPTAPSQGFSDLIDAQLSVQVVWNLKDLVAGTADVGQLTVTLGRRELDEIIRPIKVSLGLKDRVNVAVNPHGQGLTYHLRLVNSGEGATSLCVGSESDWSVGLLPTAISFRELRQPQLREQRDLSVHLLRRYFYGRCH